ncbi:putative 6-phospho-beta-glucosidase [Streptomyces sp. YIM 130001]|uniref:6-phospho-beta-glucosidase n=1 Tax=Streptomyces sp. YIM 130001 TaxID=2259644 RepID=UPI000E64C051|nr:6-phospho-beta-glucosidase [Streptomyces sp. YIM 130001]RII13920.1 putative 6-phospho-beta-glucosidase [Streptomyces sp. YIM 130001]
MKLSILGGGGFRTPHVYQALLRDRGAPRVEEVALHDIDETRLRTMVAILTELAEGRPDAPVIRPTLELETAVEGSDFVFAALRVGGLDGRCRDEHVALGHGVLGQETTGPGGLAYALRTVPVMTRAARTIKKLAPDAYVMNFTNPAGIITEAMQTVLGDRVLGICDTPSGLGRRVARLMRLDPARLRMDYVGLNHLGWLRGLLYDGRDVLPELLADDALLGELEEGRIFGADWIRTLGSIPNEYLYYYYFNRDAVHAIREAGATRGEQLRTSQTDFYRNASAHGPEGGLAGLWRSTVERRSASYMAEARSDGGSTTGAAVSGDEGYAGVALGVMAAISRDERQTMILNVRNNGTVQGLPDDCVVEVPTLVDASGVHPLTTDRPDLHQLGLMAQVKDVERHVIAAALDGSRQQAVAAFALHPLVDSVTVARSLADGYLGASQVQD